MECITPAASATNKNAIYSELGSRRISIAPGTTAAAAVKAEKKDNPFKFIVDVSRRCRVRQSDRHGEEQNGTMGLVALRC